MLSKSVCTGDLKSCPPFYRIVCSNSFVPLNYRASQKPSQFAPTKASLRHLTRTSAASLPRHPAARPAGSRDAGLSLRGGRLLSPARVQRPGYNVPIVRALLDLPDTHIDDEHCLGKSRRRGPRPTPRCADARDGK